MTTDATSLNDLWREKSELFNVDTVNSWLLKARDRKNPEQLWFSLWYEGEVACLFADTNMGKSIYAVQIACELAKSGRRVLLFDFELSDKQFQMRYTDPETGRLVVFPETLLRAELSDRPMPLTLEETVLRIRRCVERHQAEAVIIDNITWICNRSESGDAAGELMTLLVRMKKELDISILVLAHTPKRCTTSALTQNSLAGSKRIANFMDSMFAIGMDFTNAPSGRYIKQIKVRNSELEYGADSVIRAQIVKSPDGMLRLDALGTDREETLLIGDESDSAMTEKREKERLIREYLAEGRSVRDICQSLGVSTKTVSKLRNIQKG